MPDVCVFACRWPGAAQPVRDVPKLVRLLRRTATGARAAQNEDALGNGAEGLGRITGAAAAERAASAEPATAAVSQRQTACRSWTAASRSWCVRSACDPVTEVAVPIFSDYNCDGECGSCAPASTRR